MPRPRSAVRKIKEVLRLTFAEGLSRRRVAAAVGLPYTTVCDQLHRPGVTLALLHLEYKQGCPEGYQYSQFARLYRLWEGRLDRILFVAQWFAVIALLIGALGTMRRRARWVAIPLALGIGALSWFGLPALGAATKLARERLAHRCSGVLAVPRGVWHQSGRAVSGSGFETSGHGPTVHGSPSNSSRSALRASRHSATTDARPSTRIWVPL